MDMGDMKSSECSAQPAVWEGDVGCVCAQARGHCSHFVQVDNNTRVDQQSTIYGS